MWLLLSSMLRSLEMYYIAFAPAKPAIQINSVRFVRVSPVMPISRVTLTWTVLDKSRPMANGIRKQLQQPPHYW